MTDFEDFTVPPTAPTRRQRAGAALAGAAISVHGEGDLLTALRMLGLTTVTEVLTAHAGDVLIVRGPSVDDLDPAHLAAVGERLAQHGVACFVVAADLNVEVSPAGTLAALLTAENQQLRDELAALREAAA